jgi:hypothetical protein
MLVLGDSGSGKTGALAALAHAGYNLRILDVDNGLDVLKNLLLDPSSGYDPTAHQRVEFETITDQMRNVGNRLVPAKASVWPRSIELINNWGPETTVKWPGRSASADLTAKLGPIGTWGSSDVLVIDTLSFISDAALKFMLAMNGRLGQKPHQSDWGDAQMLVEGLLQTLYDESVRCNVVINCHIKYIETDSGIEKGFPESAGRALSPKIGRYFNSVVLMKTIGKEHKLLTQSTGMVELKTSAPMRVRPEYGIKHGLAELFADLKGSKGK